MKNRYIAIGIVVVMLAVGCVVLSSDDDEVKGASNLDTYNTVPIIKHPVVVDASPADKVTPFKLIISESSINVTDAVKNAGVWVSWTGDSTVTSVGTALEGNSVKDSTTGLKLTITPESEKSIGRFDIKIEEEGSNDYAGEQAIFNIGYSLTTTINNKSITQTVCYKIIVESSQMVTLNDDNKSDSISLIIGTDVSEQIVVVGDQFKGLWYAENLPKGLAMNTGGLITGIPAELTESKKPITSTITITDFSGQSHKGTLKFTITGESKLKIISAQGAENIGPGSTDQKSINRYMMYTGSDATFTIECPPDTSKPSAPESEAKAAEVNNGLVGHYIEGGVSKEITLTPNGTANQFTFTISPNGTGEYTLVFEQAAKKAMFTVIVLNKVQDVQAGIYFDLQKS